MKHLIKDILIALAIVLAIGIIIKPTIVSGVSMEPTLYENNYVLVNKMAYKAGEVERGDIIVFHSRLKAEEGVGDSKGNKLLIKRIIGIPGDTVKIYDGNVYLNGEIQDENYIEEGYTPGDVGATKVPEGKLFVLGDNRSNSTDSRSPEVGLVDQDSVVGKAFVKLWPINELCLL